MTKKFIPRLLRTAIYVSALLASFATASASDTGTVALMGELPSSQPLAMIGLTGVKAVAGGGNVYAALMSDDTIRVWSRDNDWGVRDVPAGLTAKAIAAGTDFVMALKFDGTVVAWGFPAFGQTNVPVGLDHVKKISASSDHAVALKEDGTIVSWGSQDDPRVNTVPLNLGPVLDVFAGPGYTVAIRADKTLAIWGASYERLEEVPIPPNATNIKTVATGFRSIVAVKEDGTVVAWGTAAGNFYGQLNVPDGLNNVTSVVLNAFIVIALKSDGTLVAWGSYFDPAEYSLLKKVKAIATDSDGVAAMALFDSTLDPFAGTLATNVDNIVGGSKGTYTGTVTLNAPATAAKTVRLTSSDPSISVPATVTIPKGKTSATFKFIPNVVLTDTTVTLTASENDTRTTKAIVLHPMSITEFSFEATSIEGGNSVIGKLGLQFSVANDTNILITSDSPEVTDRMVTIPAGKQSVSFNLGTLPVTATKPVQLTVQLGTSSLQRTLTLTTAPVIDSVSLANGFANEMITGTLKLRTRAGKGGTNVTLMGDPSIANVPYTIFIPEGRTSMPFVVLPNDVATLTYFTVTASNAVGSIDKTITIKPLAVASATAGSVSVKGGFDVPITVSLSRTSTIDAYYDVEVVSGSGVCVDYESCYIPRGQVTGQLLVLTSPVSTKQKVTLRISRGGVSKLVSFTVTP